MRNRFAKQGAGCWCFGEVLAWGWNLTISQGAWHLSEVFRVGINNLWPVGHIQPRNRLDVACVSLACLSHSSRGHVPRMPAFICTSDAQGFGPVGWMSGAGPDLGPMCLNRALCGLSWPLAAGIGSQASPWGGVYTVNARPCTLGLGSLLPCALNLM